MELRRLDTPLIALEALAETISGLGGSVVLSCHDADTVMVCAALSVDLSGPLGVWLEVSDDYPASLAARDVATLSWLIRLEHVVISAATLASAHADVVRVLLSDDEVDFENEVATLRGAYNRPAPPAPVRVWSFDGAELTDDDVVLAEVSREPLRDGVVLTEFAEARRA